MTPPLDPPSPLAVLIRQTIESSRREPAADRTPQSIATRHGWAINSLYVWMAGSRLPARWRIEALADDCGADRTLRRALLAEYDREMIARSMRRP